MVEFQPPRGTRDFGPDEMRRRRWAEGLMRKVIEDYGYMEIATPTFEAAELFISRSGPQVVEQMYLFKDKGGREMVLRPELTAPVMRFYASSLKNMPKPLRIYYFGNCFRYERPQKGRYREFWQMGLEYIGKRTPQAHAEVIAAAIGALLRLGARDLEFRIGHVAILKGILKGTGIDPGADKDLMIAIDKKDTETIRSRLEHLGPEVSERVARLVTTSYALTDALEALNEILVTVGEEVASPVQELKRVLSMIGGLRCSLRFDPSISRGLDYYDGLVFEADIPSLGAEKQVCGGGAYSLSSLFGPEVEGIGFGLGFDRILVALQGSEAIQGKKGGFYVLPIGDAAVAAAFEAAERIRANGSHCIMEAMDRPVRKAISSALENGCTHLLIIGDDEVREGMYSLKDLSTQVQRRITREELDEFSKDLSEDG